MILLDPTHYSRIISHLEILIIITLAKSLLPWKVKYSQLLGIRYGHFWGVAIILPTISSFSKQPISHFHIQASGIRSVLKSQSLPPSAHLSLRGPIPDKVE